MPLYLITPSNKARPLATAPARLPVGAFMVSRPDDIVEADLPMRRLVEIWNGIAGNGEVDRFQTRAAAAGRIWSALQGLTSPRSQKSISARPAGRKATSKQGAVLALLRRPQGTTLAEMVKATGWQPHSVRGLLAGAFKKRLGLTVTATVGKGGRVYRIGK